MKKTFFLLIPIISVFLSHAQTTVKIHHTYYELYFDTEQCSSIMGYYKQTQYNALHNKKGMKRGNFQVDTNEPEACQENYKPIYTEYDKPFIDKDNPRKKDEQQSVDEGHINPFEAFCFSQAAAKETMLFSNVCPQISHVNEQEWKMVEKLVIDSAKVFGDIEVWTGVLIDSKKSKHVGKLLMPDWYWKVIKYKRNGQEAESAFLSLNAPSNTETVAEQARQPVEVVKKKIREYYPDLALAF
jgi:DNA/RNA endonuclease G (NUC1)